MVKVIQGPDLRRHAASKPGHCTRQHCSEAPHSPASCAALRLLLQPHHALVAQARQLSAQGCLQRRGSL